jgi:SAM-dependent methyltransferase
MSESTNIRRVYLGMPGYGKQTAAAGRSLWNAAPQSEVIREYSQGSLLACNFNKLWCAALNIVHRGERLDYFAMLHDDIGAEDGWLDKLIEELEAKQLDVLGVAVPIKDSRGMTSIALHREGDNWEPECRLTMRDVYELPETFTSADLNGVPLLLNTGCWVAKWNQEWCRQVSFTINDRIVFDVPHNCYAPQVESEDWYFSRLLNEMGLKIGCTRKIAVTHQGEMEFQNTHPWGSESFDHESPSRIRKTSPVPNAFPYDIPGWLTQAEGAELTRLAEGKRVLEIGSYCGLSTIMLARSAEHVTACDYFDGRGTPSPASTLEHFTNNIERHGLTEKVAICHPEATFPLPEYDLAFIDGGHEYDDVKADIDKVLAVLSPDGLIAFHDYKHPAHPGVTRAIHECGEVISVTDTLAVVKPAGILMEV